jgi:hypothetical protein
MTKLSRAVVAYIKASLAVDQIHSSHFRLYLGLQPVHFASAAVTVIALVLTIMSANAQSWGRGGAYTGASPSQGYYRGSGAHWCTWSAAKVCSAWRARGGKFICATGNMSVSCKLQRAREARKKS